MNDLGDLVFNQYAIKHIQIDLTLIFSMVRSTVVFVQLCQPSYDMNSIGAEPPLRACGQSDLQFIYILVSSVYAV